MKMFILVFFSLLTLETHAHKFHTPNFCSSQVPDFCAHLGYQTEPNSTDVFQFVVDVVAPRSILDSIQSIQVEPVMKMQHGEHGTGPVTVKRLDLNHFQVSDVFLVMEGTWIIKIQALTTSDNILLEIPIEVQ